MNLQTRPLKKSNIIIFATGILEPSAWNLHRWAALPLRLIVGYGFMEHGYAKLIHGPERFAAILHTLGVPFPELTAWATILVELLGGLTVLLGAFIPLASVPMAVVLLAAMVTVHLPYGFSAIKLQAGWQRDRLCSDLISGNEPCSVIHENTEYMRCDVSSWGDR